MNSLWLFFATAVALGYLEAIMFSIMNVTFKQQFEVKFGNIHNHLGAVRTVVYFFGMGISLTALKLFIPFVLMFPILHDGTYYIARYYFVYGRFKMDKFFAFSATTNARYSYEFPGRLILFIVGLVGWYIVWDGLDTRIFEAIKNYFYEN